MKFIRDLIGRKKRNEAATNSSGSRESLEQSYRDTIGAIVEEKDALQRPPGSKPAVSDILTNINSKVNSSSAEDVRVVKADDTKAAAPAKDVNIWDMDDTAGSSEPPAKAPERRSPLSAAAASAAAARSPARARRTKTRLIGFEHSDGDVVDLFNDVPKAEPVAQRTKFPVGWLAVVEGPGRGEAFALMAGMSQIGRGEDQAVQLDFGDNSISRTNHAAVVYDPETKEFLLGHGGKSNIVRLNDKPLISNEALKTGDVIRLGETVLRFVALCGESFDWTSSGGSEEDEDVAIA